jgi:hypothetical protein
VFAAGEDTALAPLTTDINRLLAGSSPADRPAILDHFAERYLATMRAKVPRAWSSQKQDAAADGMAGTADDASGAATPARIVDKMLRNLWLVGYIHMLLPNSCIIHVVRHPMDVALSCYTQPFGYSGSAMAWSWDLADIATQIKMTWEVAEHWEQHLPGRVNTGKCCCSAMQHACVDLVVSVSQKRELCLHAHCTCVYLGSLLEDLQQNAMNSACNNCAALTVPKPNSSAASGPAAAAAVVCSVLRGAGGAA